MKRSLFSLRALTRKSLADVTRRKGRTLLVILGILIGVLGLTAINVTGDALQSASAYSNDHSASPNISFLVQKVDPSLASTLQAVPNVQTVQIDSVYSTRWHVPVAPGRVNLIITGYADFAAIKSNPFQLTSGRLPGPGEIVMESNDRALSSVAVGDMITIDTQHGPQQVRVVGLARTKGQTPAFSGIAIGYMSADALQQISGITAPNDIEVKVFDKNMVNATAKALAGVLHAYGVTVLNASIIPELNIGPINGLLSIMSVLSIIALILTGFLIFNTVSTLVAEQTRIIGMMKAIGGTRQGIIRSYLVSVGIYAVAGTAMGIGLGILLGYQFTAFLLNLFNIDLGPYQLAWGIIITSVIVGLGVPIAAAMLPLWTGTRISVRDAMTAYGTSSVNGGNSEHSLGRRLTWVPQTSWLGLRGVFRKPGRAIMTLLALTLSGTAFLAIQTTTYSFNQLLGQIFNVYNFDAQVTLASPQPYDQIRTRIVAVPNVGRVERLGQQLVKTRWGQVVLEGFEADTQEYHYQLVAGRWFHGDEPHALVISDVAAARTHLKVGDTLPLSSATNTVTWTIIGEVHDLNAASAGFVGVMVTTVDNLNSFNGLPAHLAQTLFVQAVDRSPKAIDQLSNRLDETLSQAGLAPGVTTAQQFKNINLSTLQIVYVLFYAVAAIVALVGILGLFNTLTTSVLERRREIGILRSMGATGWRVASVFWLEGVSLGVIAWFVGLLLGIPAAYGFVALISAALVPTPFAFDSSTLGVMLIFILVIATLASFGPVMRAARVRISDTLRYE